MPRSIPSVETILLGILLILSAGLALTADGFLSVQNLFDLLNNQSVNLIFAVGLLVVLISGGIDISFSVAASVTHCSTARRVFSTIRSTFFASGKAAWPFTAGCSASW